MKVFNFFCICFLWFPIKKTSFLYKISCRRWNKHFDIHFQRIKSIHFPSKGGEDASFEEKMNGKVFFPARLGFSAFEDYVVIVFFPISTLIWRANNYVSRQGKGINGKMKVLKPQLLIVLTIIIRFFFHFPNCNHYNF